VQSDNENALIADSAVDTTIESSKERTLQWLMELDRDEPKESLFVVDSKQTADLSLSAFEAEVAARPMTRGRIGADDLDTYIGEEIVLSETGGNDIYTNSAVEENADIEEDAFEGLMAIEFSRVSNEEAEGLAENVQDGSDILGLEDDDDIGDSYLVVKRVKKPVEPAEESEPPAQIQDPVIEEIVAAPPPADVADYVHSNEVPHDDKDFDDFLAAGHDLVISEEDFEGLSLEAINDQFAADANIDSDLDLHADFVAMDDFGENLMAVITPCLSGLMEELNALIAARLAVMGRDGDQVLADVSVATDTETAQLALQQGYEPLSHICTQVPEALAELDVSQRDAILLRLTDASNGETCNRLLLEGALEVSPVQLAEPELTQVPNAELESESFVYAPEAELLAEDWAPATDEYEAIFDELGDTDFDLDFDASAGDGPIDMAEAVEEILAEEFVADDEQTLELFEENLFEAELSAAKDELAPVSPEDIDNVFSDLGVETETAGEVCGVEFEEFAEATPEAVEHTAPQFDELPGVAALSSDATEDMSWCIPEGIKFSYSSPGGSEIFAEFLDAFIEEGSSELEKLEDAISAWEAEVASDAAYTQVTRILHTIKGIAKGVGLHYYGTLIHNFETLLESVARPAAEQEQGYFRVVNAWLDAAVRGMDFVQGNRQDILSEFPGGMAAAAANEKQTATAEVVVPTAEDATPEPALQSDPEQARKAAADSLRKKEDKKLADEGARALAAQQSVRITSEKLDLLLNLTNQAQQLGVRTAQSTTRNKRASAELQGRLSSVRAHIADIADRALFNVTARGSAHSAELDALEMDQYTELQEAANILREGVEDLADLIELASRHNSQAEALLKQQATVIGSIGSSIRAARVVPVSRLMPGLRRLVRTVSNDLGKEVAFRVSNEVGTLDRDDYARCQTILEHMVRNALDHGIESSADRKAQGKPSVGQITVDVRMSGADSVIVLSDDGRGINPEAMRESAVRKGLDVDAYALSDEEALKLVFHKGFSTAAALSQISGRGVGMDIVLSELQQMGGDIQIESEVGKGTSFHIRIPSNVTVNGALLVTAGDNSYAIPLGGLVSVDEVPVETFFAAVESGEKLQMSGVACEPAYLGTLCNSGNLPERSTWRNTLPVIIAGSEARYMAIAIDDVEEALELVIRSLGAQFASVPGVAGAATTADGEAVVALDLNVLVSCFEEGQGTAVPADQPEEEKFLALVVDDSRTQRMVATSQLETVGIETATAENGAVAIDWLNTTEHLPDVILLDVEMPVKDGIQTLREIRKSARYSHIPVIMITSRTGVKHRTLAEEAGCNGYMGKPFNFRMLIGQINELTGHRLELG
jgi:chemotaxis protein histidine kinase CheA